MVGNNIKKDNIYKMKRVNVHCREGTSKLFNIGQLYGVLNKDYDIHINGSIEMTCKDYGNLKKVKVYANLCNAEGEILYVLNSWKNYQVKEDSYYSFSLYCSTVDRFFDPAELEYVEIYLSFNEKDI